MPGSNPVPAIVEIVLPSSSKEPVDPLVTSTTVFIGIIWKLSNVVASS
jgi:hypothetical protein